MPRSKNLLKNPSARDGFDHWEIIREGGDGFKCEESPEGCKPICDCTSVKENLPCWATSHERCEKVQIVDLIASGISDEKLDGKKPPITIRDWYCPRFDSGCEYKIVARLLDGDKEELDKWDFYDVVEEGADWKKVRFVFKDYPKGVRYVEFRHGGRDSKDWEGHYGAKITNSAVFVGEKRKGSKKKAVESAAGKNLLKNPWAKEGLDGWEVTSSGGDGFLVEEDPSGCNPLKDFNEDAEESSCWATSHGSCEKTQRIDLGFEGFDEQFLDEVKPEIKISEWVGTRSDAGCVYWLRVRLLNGDLGEIDCREINEEKDASGDWFKVSESFTGYGEWLRFIEFTHGGRDNCNWAGHYGAKFTGSSVKVVLEEKSFSSSSSSSSSSSDDE